MIVLERYSMTGGHASSVFSSESFNQVNTKCGRTQLRRKQHASHLSPNALCDRMPVLRTRHMVVCASKNGSENYGKRQDRRTTLLNYVQEVEPQVMEQFVDSAPSQVVAAMRQTINNLLGTLPPQFFTVRVSTVAENLAQLMYSVMMTGYMFRNTQYRMELKNTMGLLANPTSQPASSWPTTSKSSSIVASPQPPSTNSSAVSPQPSTSSTSPQPAIPSLNPTIPSRDKAPPSTSPTGTPSAPSFNFSASMPSNSDASRGNNSNSNSTSAGRSDESAATRLASGGSSSTSSTSTGTSLESVDGGDEYAPGVQKTRVQGEVLRWHLKNGLETIPAVEYMEMLEGEVSSLKQQLVTLASAPPRQHPSSTHDESKNELLEYLKGLDSQSMQELTSGAGDEVAEAMNSFIHRLLGTQDKEQLRKAASDCTANELGKLLFWLMVVGYTLRTLEVRYDMERSLDISFGSGNKELPPGR